MDMGAVDPWECPPVFSRLVVIPTQRCAAEDRWLKYPAAKIVPDLMPDLSAGF
jgi:hypothetical protein